MTPEADRKPNSRAAKVLWMLCGLLALWIAWNAYRAYITQKFINAIQKGDVVQVREWLKNGGNPNASYPGRSYIALFKEGILFGKTLPKRSVPGQPKNHDADYRLKPLILAARGGHTEVARLLLDGGADINVTDANGHTPLSLALISNHTDTAKLLIERGSNPNTPDPYGDSPLEQAIGSGPGFHQRYNIDGLPYRYPQKTRAVELIRLLFAHGAKVQDKDKNLLIIASGNADPPLMRELLHHNFDPNLHYRHIVRPDNLRAYFVDELALVRAAIGHDDTEVIQVLLDAGADVNAKSSTHGTALQAALRKKHWKVAALLKAAGAKP